MHEAPLDHPFVGAVGRAGCLCGGFHTCPALVLPGLALAAAVPTAWAAWALFAEPPDPLPPERLLGPVSEFDLAALCDLEQPAAVP